MKILFAASEIFPYAKSGGLADVAAALPKALNSLAEVFSVMPLYGFMDQNDFALAESFMLTHAKKKYKIEILQKGETYFIKAPYLSDTPNLYGDKNGDYKTNDLRFSLFCKAVVWLAKSLHVELLHLNDWHTALCAYYVKEQKIKIKTIFTIHNLAYQGVFDFSSLHTLGIKESDFGMDGVEFYSKINLLKAGIAYSDIVTTVSPSYADEILTAEFGCGLEGFLNYHKAKLYGVLNGIDTMVFDPSSDISLALKYATIEEKYKNKVALLKSSKLKDPRRSLFVMIGRLAEQKGIELLLKSINLILEQNLNLYIIGEGEERYSQEFEKLAKEHQNFEFYKGYDETFSHKLYAAADFLIMPSRFEPCGLSQFIAMRYGAIPIVHAVGGLKDSVHEKSEKCGRGVVFAKYNKSSFEKAILRALKLKKETKKIRELVQYNMQCDFSFETSAKTYFNLYKTL